MTGHLPGVVLEPTRQVQLTCPRLFASWGTRPRARDGPDLYSTTIVQAAPGTVLAVSVASVNGATGVVRLTSSTETSIAPAAVKQRSMTTAAIAALISFTRGPAAPAGSRTPGRACPARAPTRQTARRWRRHDRTGCRCGACARGAPTVSLRRCGLLDRPTALPAS